MLNMFNTSSMDATKTPAACADDGKLSARKSIGIRPGVLRDRIDELYLDLRKEDSGLRLSDIVRDGLIQFWPQIEAFLRARKRNTASQKDLVKLIQICVTTIENGVTAAEIEAALNALLAAHHAAAAATKES